MTSRIVRVGKRHGPRGTDQLITTTYSTDPATGEVTEHVTCETPTPVTETQRMRLIQSWELAREFPS